MKILGMMALWLVLGSLGAEEASAAKLSSIRCEIRKEEGDKPSQLLQRRSFNLKAEPEDFTYDNQQGLVVQISAMNADDDSLAVVQVSISLDGYVAESQVYTDGKEVSDTSLAGPGEAKVSYLVSCFR